PGPAPWRAGSARRSRTVAEVQQPVPLSPRPRALPWAGKSGGIHMSIFKRPSGGRILGAALAACLLVAGAASAQSRLVPASEFYFTEEARTTRPIVAIQGEGDTV